MDAHTLIDNVVCLLETSFGPKNFDYQPPFFNPRRVGAFGAARTDRFTQTVMIDGIRFTVTVERDPNQ